MPRRLERPRHLQVGVADFLDERPRFRDAMVEHLQQLIDAAGSGRRPSGPLAARCPTRSA